MNRLINKLIIIFLCSSVLFACKDEYVRKIPTLQVSGELNLNVPREGGVYYVSATADDDITVKASKIWCKTDFNQDVTSNNLKITVEPNTGFKRECEVAIVVYSLPTERVIISQDGDDPNAQAPKIPKITGSWQFNNPSDLAKATLGHDLVMRKIGSESADGFTSVAGPDGGKAVRVAKGSYFFTNHGIPANGESASGVPGAKVNEYTILYDYRLPELNKWYCFLKTNPDMNKDGDLFIRPAGTFSNSNIGYSPNPVPQDNQWHRLMVVCKLPEYLRFYIDGELFHEAPASAVNVDNRYALEVAGTLLFADEDGEDSDIDIAQVTIWDMPLEEKAITALGAAGATGYLSEGALAAVWKFDDPANLEAAEVGNNLVMKPSASGFSSVAGPSNKKKAVRVDLGSYFLANHGISANGESAAGAPGAKVNEYSILYDYRLPELNKWYCFLKINPDMNKDGDIFIRPAGTLANGNLGYSPNPVPQDNQWHRLVIVCKLPEYYQFYIDGELFHTGNATSLNIDNRYALELAGTLLFADEDGEDSPIDIAEVAIWRKPLSADQVSALGTAGKSYPVIE